MSFKKVTLLINHVRKSYTTTEVGANTRPCGWSETQYVPGETSESQVGELAKQLAEARRQLLTKNSTVVGYRVQDVFPTGKVWTRRMNLEGVLTHRADTPENALLYRVHSADSKASRELTLRGCPDIRIEGGEYHPTNDFNQRLEAYKEFLRQNFLILAIADAIAPVKIETIGTDGTIRTEVDHGLSTAGYVAVLRSLSPERRQQGIKRVYASVLTAKTVQITVPARFIAPATGGHLRIDQGMTLKSMAFYPDWKEQLIVGKRDTGSPFFLSRGRRSARRR